VILGERGDRAEIAAAAHGDQATGAAADTESVEASDEKPTATDGTPPQGTDELIRGARARLGHRMDRRELVPSLLLTAVFVGAAVPLALFVDSGRSFSPVAAVLLVLAFAATSRVEFEAGGGSAVPTQIVFVPMLFVLPPELVPLFVAAGFAIGNGLDHLNGTRHVERVLSLFASSIHALGPALILALHGGGPPAAADWPVYLAALGSQFVLDFAASLTHEWLRSGVRPALQLRCMGVVYPIDAALSPLGLVVSASNEFPYALVAVMPLVALIAIFARERTRRIDQTLALSDAYRGTAFLLGDVVEADDAYTGSHSRDVVELVLAVYDELALDPAERRKAEFAALLHDIGKLRVPSEIINKPGPLTGEERAVMETHTLEGERLLKRVGGLLAEVGTLVRSCHERWDGKGYPDGLLADEIPLVARIVCACDAFSAMVTDRPYRPAMAPEVAIAELRANAGTQFDPAVVRALCVVVPRLGAVNVQDARETLPLLRPAA
jgi:hypothetical protein